ncbi:hypothetical protein [Mesorhizobium sp. 1B3]|uniref:hypothetical protein n=1 Tax=Mesorhizobium sp. 1B3 TaxID=3243599 RepID=UPI003D99A630
MSTLPFRSSPAAEWQNCLAKTNACSFFAQAFSGSAAFTIVQDLYTPEAGLFTTGDFSSGCAIFD